jgi:hypothetical protein
MGNMLLHGTNWELPCYEVEWGTPMPAWEFPMRSMQACEFPILSMQAREVPICSFSFFFKNINNNKNNVACNPDLGRAVVLSVPRSAFLAYFQPAGASRRPDASKSKKGA